MREGETSPMFTLLGRPEASQGAAKGKKNERVKGKGKSMGKKVILQGFQEEKPGKKEKGKRKKGLKKAPFRRKRGRGRAAGGSALGGTSGD